METKIKEYVDELTAGVDVANAAAEAAAKAAKDADLPDNVKAAIQKVAEAVAEVDRVADVIRVAVDSL
ncbi:MAG: hypothetical protein F4107_08615 [Gemmatimonadetes bacterium]|nr:hypothetical protein [Gemmatimonadota bacterium]MYD13962.1 hypothetical protein [Gemmatimonadota bacterium]MYI65979.1 hypothetical protein [Gemmatimonadota bacterium]